MPKMGKLINYDENIVKNICLFGINVSFLWKYFIIL